MAEFVALVPARLASTRLPGKPLADIGGLPMVVRVARQAAASGAARVVVAADHASIVAACKEHGVEALLTSASHATIPPQVISDVAALLARSDDCAIATAAHALRTALEFFSPNVVKVVVDRAGRALYFSRAPVPWARDAFAARRDELPAELPVLRHVGLYAYRVEFLQRFPRLERAAIEHFESLEQLRALWHGERIAVLPLAGELPPGVDTQADLDLVRRVFEAA
jgi:3-deoxy-manno-octulosonate cytidylyltransferase (CMP-KDO synthetase)